MKGETILDEAICLEIRPWSKTSHVVTWLTRGNGVVKTSVKGAIRPKSAFLGQYDLHYTCQIVYYASARGELHMLKEVTPIEMREKLRTRWRETSLAGYAAKLSGRLATAGTEEWYRAHSRLLDSLARRQPPYPLLGELLHFELEILRLAGLAPDLSGAPADTLSVPFAIESGKVGESGRILRLDQSAIQAMASGKVATESAILAALRFVGIFMRWHLDVDGTGRRLLIPLLRQTPHHAP